MAPFWTVERLVSLAVPIIGSTKPRTTASVEATASSTATWARWSDTFADTAVAAPTTSSEHRKSTPARNPGRRRCGTEGDLIGFKTPAARTEVPRTLRGARTHSYGPFVRGQGPIRTIDTYVRRSGPDGVLVGQLQVAQV